MFRTLENKYFQMPLPKRQLNPPHPLLPRPAHRKPLLILITSLANRSLRFFLSAMITKIAYLYLQLFPFSNQIKKLIINHCRKKKKNILKVNEVVKGCYFTIKLRCQRYHPTTLRKIGLEILEGNETDAACDSSFILVNHVESDPQDSECDGSQNKTEAGVICIIDVSYIPKAATPQKKTKKTKKSTAFAHLQLLKQPHGSVTAKENGRAPRRPRPTAPLQALHPNMPLLPPRLHFPLRRLFNHKNINQRPRTIMRQLSLASRPSHPRRSRQKGHPQDHPI